jgi:hypothetical protein
MPAVSRISLRSAAPQRDGANEEGASKSLKQQLRGFCFSVIY